MGKKLVGEVGVLKKENQCFGGPNEKDGEKTCSGSGGPEKGKSVFWVVTLLEKTYLERKWRSGKRENQRFG